MEQIWPSLASFSMKGGGRLKNWQVYITTIINTNLKRAF